MGFTNADLSDKTESATSLAVHVFLSFDFRNLEFGGPIWIKNRKDRLTETEITRLSVQTPQLTETEITRLSTRSTRSETIRRRASAGPVEKSFSHNLMHVQCN